MAKSKRPIPPDDGRGPFLAAIAATPADDAPRLVYADWLDEHGENERAAFIRTQIEFAHVSRYSERWATLRKQTEKLETRLRKTIFRDLPRSFARSAFFERGFIERLTLSPRQWEACGATLLAREVVGELHVEGQTPRESADLIVQSPLGNINRLAVTHAHLESHGATRIAQSSYLASLRELDLCANYILADGIEALAASPHVANLRKLSLKYNDSFVQGATALAKSPYLQNLMHLDLSCNEIGPAGLRALTRATFANQLRELRLGGNPGYGPLLGHDGAMLLGKTRAFPHLEELDLQSNEIGDAGWMLLMRSKHLKKLKRLSLQDNDLTALGLVEAFGPQARLNEQLEVLNLQGNDFADLGQATLGRANCPALRQLNLERCRLNADGIARLVLSNVFASVEVLTLNYNLIGNEGVVALARAPSLRNLGELNLINCEIEVEGAKALAQAHLPNLRHLALSYNRLNSASIIALTRAAWFDQLFTLSLAGIDFRVKAAQALANTATLSHVFYLDCSGVRDQTAQALLQTRFKNIVRL